ncbi:MAG TPA: hypothetical protein ENN39_07500 [Desulfonatronum sp.]|nr:hypothetical protein [Desulfonatronum sp.]
MPQLTEEQELQKRQIYETLSQRARKYVDKVGYDAWDPFQQPNDPIDLRKFTTDRTARALAMAFLHQRQEEQYSNDYARAVLDISMGLMDNNERYRAMYEFCRWYCAQPQVHEQSMEQRSFSRE